MATRFHTFGERAPSVPQLRNLLRKDAKAGATLVVFERGEQASTFELDARTGRWHHAGNGLLKAGYKLGNLLDSEFYKSIREGTAFKL